ncbi:Alpha/Beta hydrolase protein [Aspergillus welwitschiae]|uniref:Prolyl endopeptidase n=1 Tax=Aspergillus welwitschiae TaxID=1341132 RepID=A0A3F3QC54_9EURO|nr:Alpha/Beta hydrolase protein [Aspergillus welwitschiae]RDH36783.1 Alpha/Beta hydrolase protein [Aspergillus welwitschiae]
MPPSHAPYGKWTSPLTADRLSTDSISLHEVVVDESTGAIYSVECHPTEGGRFAIIQHLNGQSRDVLPRDYSAHATVQELGGGSILMRPDGRVLFSDEKSCSLYLLDPASSEVVLVHSTVQGVRYADFCNHPVDTQWVLAIKEDHRDATPETQATDVHNTLVAIDILSDTEVTIAQGDDFYSHPKFDPSGKHVSWIQWTHPDMPWTGTVLYVAEWAGGCLRNITKVAGEYQKESIAQPKWGLDGALYFASDRTGYLQLYSYNVHDTSVRALYLEGLANADFAAAEWELGSSTYISLDEKTMVATAITHATSELVLIDIPTLSVKKLGLQYVDIGVRANGIFRASSSSFVVVGASTKSPQELSLISLTSSFEPITTVLKSTASFNLAPDYVSAAKEYTAPQKYGPRCDGNVHMFYFPPCNPEFECDGHLPPLLVYVHGGPNGCVTPALNLEIQYWTTRGFAVCALNYTGSTGFGREYRERLSGYWGLVDTGDAVSAVEFLANEGLIDKARVGIYGGSAGGYLTLQALHMYPDVWAAGVSSYGISDVRALQADSYKFESQDVDRLLLSKTAKEDREQELTNRSPCNYAHKMKAPLLLLQGTSDMVVPVAQARMMANAMRVHGRVAEVVEFENEGHGWVGEKTIYESYKRKEDWWTRHLT